MMLTFCCSILPSSASAFKVSKQLIPLARGLVIKRDLLAPSRGATANTASRRWQTPIQTQGQRLTDQQHQQVRQEGSRAVGTSLISMMSTSASAGTATKSSSDDSNTQFVSAMCAVPDNATADAIADALLSAKLAACVNIVPGIRSVYWWDGKVVKDEELLLIIKTQRHLIKQVDEKITQLHPYDVHELAVQPIIDGNPDYLSWIEKSTTSGATGGGAA